MAEVLVPIGIPLPPKPDLTKPQMNPYYLGKRSGKISNRYGCGCGTLFNKRSP